MHFTQRPAHEFNQETLIRQRLVRVALGQEEADLVLRGATVLSVHSQVWHQNWDIVISEDRLAWLGPRGQWPGQAQQIVPAEGSWAVPGFGEAHKHIESTMLSPEYEADLVLRFGTTWNVEASHEFSNVNGARSGEMVRHPVRSLISQADVARSKKLTGTVGCGSIAGWGQRIVGGVSNQIESSAKKYVQAVGNGNIILEETASLVRYLTQRTQYPERNDEL